MQAAVFAAPVMLDIDGAGKTYNTVGGEPATALLPVTAQVGKGEFVSLVGPSGCGKTTLLKMCAGLFAPSVGSIVFEQTGKPVVPGLYGFVFQSPALLPWRTVFENVLLPAVILGLPLAQAKQRARALIDLVHLPNAAEKYPRELSGGMQQRVSIARAMLHDPPLLFMDEPFGALDAMTREDLNMELQRIQQDQKKTVVFVTHDIDEAVMLSDRIIVLSSGPGRMVGDVAVTLPRPRTLQTRLTREFGEIALTIRDLLQAPAHA
jgi:NitT/TauT family transport system ATP-binding protein